jgi:biopolymer transport protein ExbD
MKARYNGWTKTAVKWPNKLHCRIDASGFGAILVALLFLLIGDVRVDYHGRSADLPRIQHASSMPGALREDAMVISVTRDGATYYRNTRITADDLRERIRESVRNGAEGKTYIQADARAKYIDVELVLNEISKVGIHDVCFLAEKVSP